MAYRAFFARLIPLFVLVGAGLLWRAWTIGPRHPGECRVWFLSIGQGDAELLEAPDGSRMLIDGGPDKTVLSKLGQILPPWDRRIDALMLSHSDADHVAGLAPVLERYRVGVIYESGIRGRSGAAKFYAADPVARRIVAAGDAFDFGGARVEILAPSDARPGSTPDNANTYSIAANVSCNGRSVLFMGDLPDVRERLLLGKSVRADVLKIGHHGSATSSDPAFLDAVRPAAAVIEVGEGNTFGHPHPAVLARLNKRGIQTWRTDRDGDLLFRAWSGGWDLAPKPLPF